MASPERDEFGNMVDAGDTKYWNDDFAGGFANQYPVQRLQSGTPGSMSLGVQTMDPGQNLPLPPARGPAGFDNRGPAGFDNDGFFGDPRRMAQELNFDPATGEYTPFGYNGGPLASGIFGATPTPPDMSLLSEQRTPLSDMGYDPETTARLAAMLDPNSTTRPAPPIPGMAPRDGDPRRMSLLSPTTGVNGGTILNPVAVDPVRDGTVSLDNGFEQETTISPGQPIPGMIPRVGAFEPRPMPGGEGMFSNPFMNVERGANVPDWMLDNPDFDPRSPSQSGMQEYTNPATGETYMGSTSSNNQYMLDPSLTGEFTPPNRSFSLESGEVSDPNLMRQEIGTVNGDLLSDIGVAPAAQGVSSFGDMSSNDMQRMLNRGSISQGSVSEVQQIIDSPQPVTPPAPVAANPIIDVLGTGNVLEPGSSNFAAPSQGDYNFGVQDTFTPPSMMSEYQSAFPQLPSFGQAMPVQQALPQGGLGSLGQTPLPLQQFNVSGSFNAPPIKSPYV